jgi:PBP1b-binding outer membrane lipoprotein LpoB
VIEFSTTEEGTEGPKIEEHLPEIDEIKTLTKQIVSEQPKDIELEFDIPEGKSEIYRESIEVSKSSVEISDETICGAGTSSSTMLGLFGKISTLSVYFMSSVISGESFSTVSIVLSTVVVISAESLNISSVGRK